MGGKKKGAAGDPGKPPKHFCPQHEEEAKVIMVMPKRRIFFDCPQGHRLSKKQTELR